MSGNISSKSLSYLIGDPSKSSGRVSLVLNGKWRSFLLSSDVGKRIVDLLRQTPQDIEAIAELADIQAWVAKRSQGRVTVDECDRLRLDGKLIDYGLTGRIGQIIEQGVTFEALANFIERVARNPDPTVAEDLYRFMEKGNLPLDPEGYVLAFKKVDDAYLSFRSGSNGKVSYAPGTMPAMPREECDPNRNVTCSRGLHACSYEYLQVWYRQRGRVMIVRIDPEHVTAIPTDHDDQKLRCCQMEVVGEIDESEAKDHFKSVVDTRYPAQAIEAPELEADDPREVDADEDFDLDIPDVPQENTRLKLIPIDDDLEPVEANWTKIGHELGVAAGEAHFKGGFEYEPSLVGVYPDDLPKIDRPIFCQAYVEGYESGFRAAETMGRWDLERAISEGKACGMQRADTDYPYYNNVSDAESDIWDELISWIGATRPDDSQPEEHELARAFARAERDAYHTRFTSKDDEQR